MTRTLWTLVTLALLAGCGGGSPEVPSPIRDQLRADRDCEPEAALIVSTSPAEQIWNVTACGDQLTMRCPVEGDSLGRCAYGPPPTTGGAAPIAGAPSPGAPTAAPAERYPDDPDGPLRVAIDARASAVLACTDGELTAVDVSWTIDGASHVELTGELSGTPAEACVAEALAGLPIPEGEAGRLRHPVRAP